MEMATTKGGRPVHVLAVPLDLHGHLYPMLWLSKQLALRGVTVTFLVYESTIREISSPQNADDDTVFGKTLHFEILPKAERPPLEAGHGSVLQLGERLYEDFGLTLTKLVQDKKDGRPIPTCIMSDMLVPQFQDAADQLEIPSYVMLSSGAILALLVTAFSRLHEDGDFKISEKDGRLIKNDKGYSVPGLPHLLYHELNTIAITNPAVNLKRSLTYWRAPGLLVNTFLALEDQIIDSFKELKPPKEYGPGKKVPKLYPLDPMLPMTPDFVVSVASDQAQQSPPNGCLAWLDSQPLCSVLYVAFGTLVNPSPDNIRELAFALEASQQRFLWVMRGVTSDALPDGFEARVSERGFVVRGWAPQVGILAHPATAAFWTHCGWNSCTESVLMGIPMIGWPGAAEQHLNCRYLTDRLRIMEQIQTGPENVLRRGEALRATRLVMEEEEGKLIKERVKELQKLLIEATSEGGSRSREIQSFVDDLRQLP